MTGELALEVALREVGVHEIPPGSNTGPRVREYLSGCVRGGKLVRLDRVAWCAAFASWCAAQAPGLAPHQWRAAVRELVEDARALGAWRLPEEYPVPKPGDLGIYKRAGHDPTRGEEGHVGRVAELFDDGRYTSVEGNSGDRVQIVTRHLGDPDLCGWIVYP